MVSWDEKIHCDGIMSLRKYLKIYSKFLHTSIASELEYKTNIIIDLVTAIFSLIGSIFLLSIFFQNNGSIGSWKFEQALIIQGIYTILNGITNTWFNPNLTEIVKHIREGTLDFVLIKPIDSQFYISLKKINPSGLLEIMLGFFLLLYCIRINQINLNLSFLTLSLVTIICSISILYSLWFFISTTTIWFVKTWNATEVLRSFLYIGRFPLNSFSLSLRIFFSVFIPIAFITNIPSEVFLGISQLWEILLEVIIATIFLVTSRKFWLFALKFYTSASS
ncbi:conserved membrane protein [Prochlorococcus marinus str. GP2]|uniref:Conserved membrane protein n=2 Tax=Prochlorococcus marinus TaxID=1219 RepID=A0A0A1ZEI7_PROMR|nr:conserved membrane protein [Prochlorococcus marinus str. GP2]